MVYQNAIIHQIENENKFDYTKPHFRYDFDPDEVPQLLKQTNPPNEQENLQQCLTFEFDFRCSLQYFLAHNLQTSNFVKVSCLQKPKCQIHILSSRREVVVVQKLQRRCNLLLSVRSVQSDRSHCFPSLLLLSYSTSF
jgi:hypothetical protein